MMYESNGVHQTKSGIFVRLDDGVGMLAYSPYTGLMFVVHSRDIENCLAWMDGSGNAPGDNIGLALGYGWDKSVTQGVYPVPHYLSDLGSWDAFPWPSKFPILVNWFLTGHCPLSCQYCDAEDIMSATQEPRPQDITRIASQLLRYNPIAVVLTGGEPLTSPYLEDSVKLLHCRAGVMVDTNGVLLDRRIVKLFKKYDVVVRISIDSPIPRVNDQLRRFRAGQNREIEACRDQSSLKAAVNAMSLCLDEHVPLTIQTVASKKNWNDLFALGDRLYRLGVRSWRVHIVSVSKNHPNRKSLVVPVQSRVEMIPKLSNMRNRWVGMDLQILDDVSRNSVVIISPDGRYVTESATGKGKIDIDPQHPYQPDPDRVFSNVSADSHAKRYFGDRDTLLGRWLSE